MQEFLRVCLEAVHAGGAVLMEMQDRIRPREKAPKDLVTEADVASQSVIRELIKGAFPNHEFVGEEDLEPTSDGAPPTTEPSSDFCWVVDPLDGTMNYVHKLPGYAVSVALRRGNELLVGAVFDPLMKECFSAQRGDGARLNGNRISPSPCDRLYDALVAVSLPANIPRNSAEIARLLEVLQESQAIRRLGSAALNMAYVAMGRLDAYYATCVKPWDVAAGALILTEAGGCLSDLGGRRFDLDNPIFAAASTPLLHQELIQVLARSSE